eukprot:gene6010-12120_t
MEIVNWTKEFHYFETSRAQRNLRSRIFIYWCCKLNTRGYFQALCIYLCKFSLYHSWVAMSMNNTGETALHVAVKYLRMFSDFNTKLNRFVDTMHFKFLFELMLGLRDTLSQQMIFPSSDFLEQVRFLLRMNPDAVTLKNKHGVTPLDNAAVSHLGIKKDLTLSSYAES